jgi:amidohydrolase
VSLLDHSAVAEVVDQRYDDIVDLRRTLHQIPELGHEERETTLIIRSRLSSVGLTEQPAGAPTGAVFRLEGSQPGRTVLMRADIDGLPVTEEVDLPFASRLDGRMHACGHDGHTAMLMGVAEALASRAEDLPGRYIFLFQPAEEGGMGARRMIEGGVLDGLGAERSVGCHLTSGIMPSGMVAMRPGIQLADGRLLSFDLRGPGGHGALATREGNVILAAAALAERMGSLTDGLSFDDVACVCSAGTIHAGTAPNVVPQTATITGTLRTFTPEQTTKALARMEDLQARLAEEFSVEVHVTETAHLPAVDNDPAAVEVVSGAAAAVLGPDRVLAAMPPVTPSDDMSEFLARIPGCYFFVGATPQGGSGAHHSPTFRIEEEALRTGAQVMAAGAVALARDTHPTS